MNGTIRPICANKDENCQTYQRINHGRLTTVKKRLLICLDLFSSTPGCIKFRLPINYQRVLILFIPLISGGSLWHFNMFIIRVRIIIIITHRHRNRIITTNVITNGSSNRATKGRQGRGIVTR
jgi:hypothetical protein